MIAFTSACSWVSVGAAAVASVPSDTLGLAHSAALHAVATHPGFREAVAWQNPHALRTGVDALLRRERS